MLIRFETWMLALLCCLIVSPASAAGHWNSSVVLSTGYAKERGACTSPLRTIGLPTGNCSEGKAAFRIAYDYQFTSILGLEVSYGELGRAKAYGSTPASWSGGQGTWEMTADGWAVAVTGNLPVIGGLSLFGKAGWVRAEFDEDLNFYCVSTDILICPYGTGDYHIVRQDRIGIAKNHIAYGLGLQYDFSDSYAIRTQYENFGSYDLVQPGVGTIINVRLVQVSAGIVLKF